MKAQTPEDCDRLFAEHCNAGRLDDLLALYEPTATFVPQTGPPAEGIAAIREALAGLLSAKPEFRMHVAKVVRAGGDLAAVYNDWTVKMKPPGGDATEGAGKAFEIVRRQPDGSWKYVFDDPFLRG
ncbi:MAG TPA: nuclear transport factor 2 family protein [Candidatus Binatia bacterium]|nr:nuclear transport factor 2 family protein [Candidatus Binatia bacterium]